MTATLRSDDPEDRCPACGKVLSRLTVSPLPKEIAGLISFGEHYAALETHEPTKVVLSKLTAALLQQAREIERLKELTNYSPAIRQAMHKFDAGMKLRERIRELESKRDALIDLVKVAQGKDAEAERDSIKEKTIEECAALFDLPEGWGQIAHSEVAKRIRALKQKPQAETE